MVTFWAKLVFWWKVRKWYEIDEKWGNFSTLFKLYEEKLVESEKML